MFSASSPFKNRPALEKHPADRCCGFLADQWLLRGGIIHILKNEHRGNHLRVVWPPAATRPEGQLLVLGHYDTVYPTGTLGHMPFRIAGGKAFGPGTFDMKAGIVQALFALEALQELKTSGREEHRFSVDLRRRNRQQVFPIGDRSGSEAQRRRLCSGTFARPSRLGEDVAQRRRRSGVASCAAAPSHAGLAPEKGINAIHELAAQIARIERWNNPRRGVTINADIVEGGSRTNVIADHAKATLDLRAWRASDMRALESRLHSLKPIHRGAKLEITGGFDRPPLERKHSAALFARAKVARQANWFVARRSCGRWRLRWQFHRRVSAFPLSMASAPSAMAPTPLTSTS